jgi:hypothetical protein
MVVTEVEIAGALFENDHPRFGQPIDSFGSTAGAQNAVTVTGHLRAPAHELTAGGEPDGSIPLAQPVAALVGARVALTGMIGDGAYGSGGPIASGDFDFYSLTLSAGQTLEVIVRTPDPAADLNPIVALYSSTGELLELNDNLPIAGFLSNYDSYLIHTAVENGTYCVAVGGWSHPAGLLDEQERYPSDPFDPASGPGAGSEGSYRLILGLDAPDPGDRDCYTIELRAGDVFGATVFEGAAHLMLLDLDNQELVGTVSRDLSSVYPDSSPLPGGGQATIAWVADRDAVYAIAVTDSLPYGEGSYTLELEVYRPPLEDEAASAIQVLFLDFDGATVSPSLFGAPPGPEAQLSPLNAFLSGWGLADSDAAQLIDAIVDTVTENLQRDVRLNGANGDSSASGIRGEFDIEIRNSRDHPDPFGQPGVTRVIVGGTIDELGLLTIAIAQSVDVGNLDTDETAVVLLDLLSAPAGYPDSLNSVERSPGLTMVELVGTAVGNLAAHEAGHLFANFHTERDTGPPTLMDRGGRLLHIIGAGEDLIFGSGDDIDIDLGPDTYEPSEGLRGIEHTLQTVSFGLPTGGMTARAVVRPAACSFGAWPLGSGTSCAVSISNQGQTDLQVHDIDLGGADAAQFTSSFSTGVVAPGGVLAGSVAFLPTSPGRKEAVLLIASNDVVEPVATLPLDGQGAVADALLTPAALDFGELVYGNAGDSLSRDFVLANAGPGDLHVAAVLLSGTRADRFRIDSGAGSYMLAAGESRSITVSFAPAGWVGEARCALKVSSGSVDGPAPTALLSSRASGPDLELSPSSPYNFGGVRVGESRWRYFTVSNLGNRNLVASATVLEGPDADQFSIAFGAEPFSLSPGDSHAIQVWFSPDSTGEKSAVLVIHSNDPDEGVFALELEAEGVVPEAVLAPDEWDFGAVPVGASMETVIWIENRGQVSLRISETELTGADSGQFRLLSGSGAFTLNPGARRQIRIAFEPTGIGTRQAILRVVSNDPEHPIIAAALSGTGVRSQPAPGIPDASVAGWLVLACLLGFLGARKLQRIAYR